MLDVHNVTIDCTTHVILLKIVIYGLVQDARQWWPNFKEIMATFDYYPSISDHCLFINQEDNGESIAIVIIYVDDDGIIGTPHAIKEVSTALGNVFNIKTMGEMEKFVGCPIIDTIDRHGVWIHQPTFLKN
jgi:Reverse transcriptase (RNA-dependent DNA polymerase)